MVMCFTSSPSQGCKYGIQQLLDGSCFKMSAESFGAPDDDDGDGQRDKDEPALEDLRSEEFGADEFNLLSDDDMQIFGLNPLTDDLNLVSCNVCKKPVIDSQFSAHYKRCIESKEPHVTPLVLEFFAWKKGTRQARSKLVPIGEQGRKARDQSDSKRKHVIDTKETSAPDYERIEPHVHVVERGISGKRGQNTTIRRSGCFESEAHRPGLSGRKGEASPVSSTFVDRLESPTPREPEQEVHSPVVADDPPQYPGAWRTRQPYIKLDREKGRKDGRKMTQPRVRDTSVDHDAACLPQQGRTAARATTRHREQDIKPGHSEILEAHTGGRQRQDILPDVRKGTEDSRALRRQWRERVKDRNSVENSTSGSGSSKNHPTEEVNNLVNDSIALHRRQAHHETPFKMKAKHEDSQRAEKAREV